jgi:hypothetical protein
MTHIGYSLLGLLALAIIVTVARLREERETASH